MADTSQIRNWYLSLFKDFESHLNGEKSSPFHKLRREAIEKFAETDFPNTHQEDWRFTDVSPILKHTFAYADRKSLVVPDKAKISGYLFGDMKSHLLVFINGTYSPGLSKTLPVPKGAVIGCLADAMKGKDGMATDQVFKYSSSGENAFSALNLAFTTDGAYVYLPDGVVVDDPVHILFLSTGSEETISQPRNLIVTGRDSRVMIVEHYANLDGSAYFTNAVTQVRAGENAHVDAVKIQSESHEAYHISTTDVALGSDAGFESHGISLGAAIYRHDLNVALTGEGGNTTLEGLYLLSGNQLSDTHSMIDHISPHCTSQEHYKGILDGKSHGVFNGKIMVRRDAQQTNSYQENRNIILSNEAKVDTKPQLEIFADDVKCSHGATVGRLSSESMFYLKSRGIGEEQAKLILIYAFASDVLKGIRQEEVRSRLESILSDRFLGVPS